MSKNKEPFLKLVVAALPMLSKTIFFRNAFFLGGVIAAAFWLTESFFAVTHAWFPVRLRGTAKVFWVAAMVQISQTLAGVTPLWGIGLWLIGYILGIVLFAFVPQALLGWIIMPVGIIITLWVLFKKTKSTLLNYYLFLAVCWTLIAIIFDYFFLVKIFKPADGYYKLDVYLYYFLIFILPLAAGWRKNITKK